MGGMSIDLKKADLPNEGLTVPTPLEPIVMEDTAGVRRALAAAIQDTFKGRGLPVLSETLIYLVNRSSDELFQSARRVAVELERVAAAEKAGAATE